MRVELGAVAHRAPVGKINLFLGNAGGDELAAESLAQVDVPLAVGAAADGRFGAERGSEFVEHLAADFECVKTDGRPDGSHAPGGRRAHFAERRRRDCGNNAAPSRVHGGYLPAVVDGEQDRDAIRHAHRQHAGRIVADDGVGVLRGVEPLAGTDAHHAGTVHLVYAAQMPSLLRSVLLHGWPVWAPLLLALLAWLWARAQRFGPVVPAPAAERRSLLEHVRASGQHLSRYNKHPLLYQAVKHSFLARLRRRDPLTAALVGAAQAAALAQHFGLPLDTVQRALQSPASHDTAAFRERVATLIQLRNRL